MNLKKIVVCFSDPPPKGTGQGQGGGKSEGGKYSPPNTLSSDDD